MSQWGPWCRKCGHPAAYHGASFCKVWAGSDHKQSCDCDGYDPREEVMSTQTGTDRDPQGEAGNRSEVHT